MFDDLYSYQIFTKQLYNIKISYIINPSLDFYFVINNDNTKICKYYPKAVPQLYDNEIITKGKFAKINNY